MPALRDGSVKGKEIGLGRLALRLTVKNVWYHQEMVRRNILSNQDQRERVRQEVRLIVDAGNAVCRIAK